MGTEVESPNSNQRVSQIISESFLFLEEETDATGATNGNGCALPVGRNIDATTIERDANNDSLSSTPTGNNDVTSLLVSPSAAANGNVATSGSAEVLRKQTTSSSASSDVKDVPVGDSLAVSNEISESSSSENMPDTGSCNRMGGDNTSPDGSRFDFRDSANLADKSAVSAVRVNAHSGVASDVVSISHAPVCDSRSELRAAKSATATRSEGADQAAIDSGASWTPPAQESTQGSRPSKGHGAEEDYERRLKEQARAIVGKVLNCNSLREALKKNRTWCKNRRLWRLPEAVADKQPAVTAREGKDVVASDHKAEVKNESKRSSLGHHQDAVRRSQREDLNLNGSMTFTNDTPKNSGQEQDKAEAPRSPSLDPALGAAAAAAVPFSSLTQESSTDPDSEVTAATGAASALATSAASAPVVMRRKKASGAAARQEAVQDGDDSAASSPGQSPASVRRHVLRSPVLRLKQEWNSVEIGSDSDSSPRGSEDSDDDEDGGIYAESYRNSQWLYLGGPEGATSTDTLDTLDVDEDNDDGAASTSDSVFETTHDASLLADSDVTVNDMDASAMSAKEPLNASVDSGLGQNDCSPRLYKQKVQVDDLPPTLPRRPRHHRSESISTTASEIEFRKRYQAKTRRIVHRKSSTQTYQRMSERFYDEERCLVVERQSVGEPFGFHIRQCRPVVVSTVEEGSAAQRAGVRVGDAVIAVNDVNVMEASHQEAIRLIGQDPNRVKLTLTTDHRLLSDMPLHSGYLIKQGGSGLLKNWRRRWFVLKQDHCLYYYKTEEDKDPLGAIMLTNYTITKAPEANRKNTFKAHKYGQRTYYFQAESEDDMNEWANALSNAANTTTKTDTWLDVSSHNVGLPALSIREPDCHGHMTKLGHRRKNWKRRYCVLKDACLYYYVDLTSSTAQGVAHLHGYSVDESFPFNKKFGFTLVPPDPSMRTFYFFTDNETDMRRWIKAMRKSIGRWVKAEDY